MVSRFIRESGMDFCCPKDECFYIEKSRFYDRIKKKGHVMIAEFILYKDNLVYIVEAKSSSPAPGNAASFGKYIFEICQKFACAFSLLVALHLHRYELEEGEELPSMLKDIDWRAQRVRFVLVINGHKAEWLPPLQDRMRESLLPFIHAWNLEVNSVMVINDSYARKAGLIR